MGRGLRRPHFGGDSRQTQQHNQAVGEVAEDDEQQKPTEDAPPAAREPCLSKRVRRTYGLKRRALLCGSLQFFSSSHSPGHAYGARSENPPQHVVSLRRVLIPPEGQDDRFYQDYEGGHSSSSSAHSQGQRRSDLRSPAGGDWGDASPEDASGAVRRGPTSVSQTGAWSLSRTKHAAKRVVLSRPEIDALRSYHQSAHRRGASSTTSGRKYLSSKRTNAVTKLKNLYNSQYVGAIGVGSISVPHRCAESRTTPVNFVLSEFAKLDGSLRNSCHYEEQSMIDVVFDTGSTNLWIASDLCTTAPCTESGRKRYNHMLSESFQKTELETELDIEFGTGELKGEQGQDDFHVGPFTVEDQSFGMIREEIGDAFKSIPFEGILGLAFPSMSAGNVRPFFDNVIAQGVLAKNEFAFYFNMEEAATVEHALEPMNALFWGGVDEHFYEGPIKRYNVTQPHYWAIDLLEFRVGDEAYDVEAGERIQGTSSGRTMSSSSSLAMSADVDVPSSSFVEDSSGSGTQTGGGSGSGIQQRTSSTRKSSGRYMRRHDKELDNVHEITIRPADVAAVDVNEQLLLTNLVGRTTSTSKADISSGSSSTSSLASVAGDFMSGIASSFLETKDAKVPEKIQEDVEDQREEAKQRKADGNDEDLPLPSLRRLTPDQEERESSEQEDESPPESLLQVVTSSRTTDETSPSANMKGEFEIDAQARWDQKNEEQKDVQQVSTSSSRKQHLHRESLRGEYQDEVQQSQDLQQALQQVNEASAQQLSLSPPRRGNTIPKLVIDSGTTYFTAGKKLYKTLSERLPPVDCDEINAQNYPPLAYVLQNAETGKKEELLIPQEIYMVTDENGQCELAFMEIDLPHGYGPGMLLGEVFMRHYFTVFTREHAGPGDNSQHGSAQTGGGGSSRAGASSATVGFARAKVGSGPMTRLRQLTSESKPSFGEA
ncbi:unnamed protein product [Amoebophrya sp. A25]|nr:unnamed protein product [Amoebophrya sp. A25]|eukprot:GSA25T00017065001.1